MRTRDAVSSVTARPAACGIDDVLVMVEPQGVVHGLSRGWQGKLTLCGRPMPEAGAVARFHGVVFATLRAAGWPVCGECESIRTNPRGVTVPALLR